jgi:hypothetical protein
MVSSTIDHMVAVTVFLAATLLFIGLFNQTISTAVTYQRHRALATKASDLLDGMLLSPGIPVNWGQTDAAPTGFGIQDPEFTQYQISSFSLMRLAYQAGTPVYYYKTGSYYNNITVGSENFLLVSNASIIDYSTASKLLGINNTYGFQLSLTPIVDVKVTEDPAHAASPLRLLLDVQGTGFPLANAEISYCLLTVSLNGGTYPTFDTIYGTANTDKQGLATLSFNQVTDSDTCYAFIAYAHLGGLVGVGYCERVSLEDEYVVPLVDSLSDGRVLLAHNYDILSSDPPSAEVKYNASFVFLSEDYTFREMPLDNSAGHVNSGNGFPYESLNVPMDNPGILLITYKKNANEGGIVMMPWGVSSLSFPIVFGGDPSKQEWVATDMRQVTVGGIAYQAKLALWSLEGYQVNG